MAKVHFTPDGRATKSITHKTWAPYARYAIYFCYAKRDAV